MDASAPLNPRTGQGGRHVIFRCAMLLLGCAFGCDEGAEPRQPPTEAGMAELDPSPPISSFALYAGNSVEMRDRARVDGANVGVRRASPGPHLFSGFELALANNARVDPNFGVYGDSVRLDSGATIGNVYTNGLTQVGATFGQVSPFVELSALPPLPAITPGTSNIAVSAGAVLTRAAGQYAAATVNGTLRLSGGIVHVASLTLGPDARVEALAPVELRIAGRVSLSDRARILPATGAAVTARELLLIVAGTNATSSSPTSVPAAVALGNDSLLRGLFFVPNGTLRFGARTQLTGAVMARDIRVENDARVSYELGFSCPTDCDDGNPCTEDVCVLTQCQHTVASNGTSCSDGDDCNGSEVCGGGSCSPGTPPEIDDANPCTLDSCDPELGVLHDPAPEGTSCDADADVCTGLDSCDGAGVCEPGAPPEIDDGNPCTVDECDPALGVMHQPATGLSCADDDVCDGAESCTSTGQCVGEPPDPLPPECDSTPPSTHCGDAIRDPITEECDDGPGMEDDSCSETCRIHNIFITPVTNPGGPRIRSRSLGYGRHPVAAGAQGSAVVFTETTAEEVVLASALFDVQGRRVAVVDLQPGARPSQLADPVVAALPSGAFAVAWNDLLQGASDVGLRRLESGSPGPVTYANASLAGNQQDPDLVWTGSELVVGWIDGFTAKLRRFNADLAAISQEQSLSAPTEMASSIALGVFDSGWAAAWRTIDDSALEVIRIRSAAAEWSSEAFEPGAAFERPALLELDASHLLVVFGVGTYPAGLDGSVVARLRGAILDLDSPGVVQAVPLEPLLEPYASDATFDQLRPALVRVGSRNFLLWEGEGRVADPLSDQVWLSELEWNVATGLTRQEERPLQVDASTIGSQRTPAAAASPLGPQGALVTVWEERSNDTLHETLPDIAFGLRPVPLVSLAPTGGGG